MKMNGLSYRVRPGGLMRCCLLTLDEHMNVATVKPEEGERLACRWCKDADGMVFTHGAWQWAKDWRQDLADLGRQARQ